ncbi:MAG: hypothetical protein HXY46_16305 [Syntrophaceae bacterium]|nr:hypothetical protein [Syntrophaceae bacterium]
MTRYKKYCYWLDLNALASVRKALEEEGIPGNHETHLPCRILRPAKEIGYVTPLAWNGFCKRRTSWYWKSQRAEKFLMVSNRPLDVSDCKEFITITESNFKPNHLPSEKEIFGLTSSDEYRRKKPKEWDKPDLIEEDFYRTYFERYGIRDPFDFEKLLRYHSANHANFIDPQFFEEINGEKAPYSISDSLHVCSSCLEFFNILGDQCRLKYVTPCIGAVKFAGLPINHYFEVKTVEGC